MSVSDFENTLFLNIIAPCTYTAYTVELTNSFFLFLCLSFDLKCFDIKKKLTRSPLLAHLCKFLFIIRHLCKILTLLSPRQMNMITRFMAIGYTFRKVTLPFSFLPPFSIGSSLKETNLLLKEQILSYKRIPYF